MPATTNTPAEIVRLERDIAEGVMGWSRSPVNFNGVPRDWVDSNGNSVADHKWSPWNNPADALKVLERLSEDETGIASSFQVSRSSLRIYSACIPWLELTASVPGPHFGPAVCRLAEKVLNEKQTI